MTVSDWGPDSPADDGRWLAVFVGDLGRRRIVDAAPGEHFPPAELDGYRLSSANEATRVATYRRADEQEVAESPPSVAAPGRTPAAREETAVSDREALRRDLAAIINRAWDEWDRDEVAGWRQEYLADAVIEAGFRLVSEDEATVDRVARAIHDAECGPEAHCNLTDDHFAWDVRLARAAVRALREGGVA